MKRSFFLLAAYGLLSTSLMAQSKKPGAVVKIYGEVTKPVTIEYEHVMRADDPLVIDLVDRDGKKHAYTGVPVYTLLQRAGVTLGKDLRGENLTKYVLVKCADGYEVVFSLAEFDTSFKKNDALLTWMVDGQPLPDGKGPFRLVIPGEGKPARSCFQVTEMIVSYAKE
jgi:DMSO/TMAO reductase YedYZ molybdopterin-dependent catalytic subunit